MTASRDLDVCERPLVGVSTESPLSVLLVTPFAYPRLSLSRSRITEQGHVAAHFFTEWKNT